MSRLEFTQDIADIICERIADGESLRAICSSEDLPAKSTVFKWLGLHKEFADQYARAKEAQAEHFADELIELADDDSNDVSGELEIPNGVAVQRSRLKVDTRKWVMSKLLAKKYGDKFEHVGKDGGPVEFVVKSILEEK